VAEILLDLEILIQHSRSLQGSNFIASFHRILIRLPGIIVKATSISVFSFSVKITSFDSFKKIFKFIIHENEVGE
jgi:hypothetical protein